MMNLEPFLDRCRAFGLTVVPWEEFVPRSGAGEVASEDDDEVAECVKGSQRWLSGVLEQSTSTSAMAKPVACILNELGQRSGFIPEHYVVNLPDRKFEHVVKFDEYSASHTADNLRAARNGAIFNLLKCIPRPFLKKYLPPRDFKYVTEVILEGSVSLDQPD